MNDIMKEAGRGWKSKDDRKNDRDNKKMMQSVYCRCGVL